MRKLRAILEEGASVEKGPPHEVGLKAGLWCIFKIEDPTHCRQCHLGDGGSGKSGSESHEEQGRKLPSLMASLQYLPCFSSLLVFFP